ncbi:unnamed protein product [Somion occarium]|uniref:Polyketide synthase-like phosphopantetheine-binding domain-containing protein n=1 Tax=Somion occarium TaxID=3059160 RepID=A0ABP1DRD2_9APHY
MSNEIKFPPLDWSITVIPGFVDFQAEHNPAGTWAKFPSPERPGEATSVSYLELAKATHRVAHALRPYRDGQEREVVAIIVECDTILYIALLLGVARAGLVPFPMSPRNSPEAVVNMMEKTFCHCIIYSPRCIPLVSAVQNHFENKGIEILIDNVPSLQSVFPALGSENNNMSTNVTTYPANNDQYNVDDIVIYLHSSGSTGFPKPIPLTHRIFFQWGHSPIFMSYRDRGVRWGSMSLPTFHSMAVGVQILIPLCLGEAVSLFTPQEPAPPVVPNPNNTLETARITHCTAIAAVPSFFEVWAASVDATQCLASLKLAAFAGGPLSEANGNKLVAAGVRLTSIYGTTEIGPVTKPIELDVPDNERQANPDWAWLAFSDKLKMRWVDQGDGTYELQIETAQPAVENLPDVRGYATADLFVPHPNKKGLWRIIGRTDDVIVLGSGEKIVPLPQEGHLTSVPFVSGAIMFGRQKNQAGILIEPREEFAIDPNDGFALVAFRNEIWPYVEEANKLAPSFARIFKEMILVTHPETPMPRAAKGTTQRKLVWAAYREEIDKLYETVEKSRDNREVDLPVSWSAGDAEEWLSSHAASLLNEQSPKSDVDIFEQGFDSLSATYLRNRIIGALNSSPDPHIQKAASEIPPDFIFANPTIQRLSTAVVALVNPGLAPNAHAPPSIQDLIAKYSSNFPTSKTSANMAASPEVVVVLTGSTGGIGAHLLAVLLEEPKITKVYTLNRGNHVVHRQKVSFEDKQLPVDLLDTPKLTQLAADLSREDLGLEPDMLDEIKSSATHFIHNAWKVDFNLSLSSFEGQIAATRRLVDLLTQFNHNVRFMFTSSIAVASGWDLSRGAVPETVIDNAETLSKVGGGYGPSKYVVEHLLAKIKQHGILDATSLRVGQVSGSTKTGAWNTAEWIPSIIKSSIALGCLPTLDGVVSWIPMDSIARAIVDFALAPSALPEVLNIVNPNSVPWNNVFGSVADVLSGTGKPLPLVPFAEWLAKIEAASPNATTKDFEQIPAIKLLSFLRSLSHSHVDALAEAGGNPSCSTELSQSLSLAIKDAPQIDRGQVELCLSYWSSRQYIIRDVQQLNRETPSDSKPPLVEKRSYTGARSSEAKRARQSISSPIHIRTARSVEVGSEA